MQRDNKRSNDIQIIQILGLLIVAIGVIGLINADHEHHRRTREVDVQRCLSARSRDIRRRFTVETLAVAFLGWLIGVPIGYLLFRRLLRLVLSVLSLHLPPVFPAIPAALVLAGTMALGYLVILLAWRRATHLHPGAAIRYQ